MSGEADAIVDACKMVKLSMTKMMEKVFPVVGKIVLIDNAKDDKALTVYINLGASNGIKRDRSLMSHHERRSGEQKILEH